MLVHADNYNQISKKVVFFLQFKALVINYAKRKVT